MKKQSSKIPTIKLGDGKEVPLLGLGTGVAYPPKIEMVSSLVAVIKKAILEYGVRLLDFGAIYGTEEALGAMLKTLFEDPASGIKREDLILIDKVWVDDMHDIEGAIRNSLKKVQLDYFDIYLLHWPNPPIVDPGKMKCKPLPLYKRWAAMESCVKKGLCRALGCSNFNCQSLVDLLTYAEIKPVLNEIELHPYLPQTNLVGYCQANDIQVMGYSPLGSPWMASMHSKPVSVLTEPAILELAHKYGKSPAQICINWGIQRQHILIPNTGKVERLPELLGALDFALSSEDIQKLNTLPTRMRLFDPATWAIADWGKIPIFE